MSEIFHHTDPWTHPAIAGKHTVSHTRDYPGGVSWNVATCQCGWSHRELSSDTAARFKQAREDGTDPWDDAVRAHWNEIIAASEAAA